MQILKLHINERVRRNGDTDEARQFARFLLDIGEGSLPLHPELGQNLVCIPDQYIFESQDAQQFIKWCAILTFKPQGRLVFQIEHFWLQKTVLLIT